VQFNDNVARWFNICFTSFYKQILLIPSPTLFGPCCFFFPEFLDKKYTTPSNSNKKKNDETYHDDDPTIF